MVTVLAVIGGTGRANGFYSALERGIACRLDADRPYSRLS